MSWILRIIYKIENPRIKAKLKSMLLNYPSHFLAILSTFLFIYAVYVIFTLKSLANIPIENVSIFFNVIKVGIVLSCFFVIISRNKLKNNEYMFFYLNSNVKAYQFILGISLHLYIFYCFILLFLFTPVLINILIEIGKINIFFISFLLLILTFIFLLTITIWTVLNIFLMKLTKNKKESLFLNTIFLLLIMFGSYFLVENYLKEYLIKSPILSFFLIFLGSIIVILGLKEISSEFLETIFKQKNAGNLLRNYKNKNLYYQNRYLVQTKLEWINFTRNMIFKEQGLLFLLLIIITIGMNYFFDKTNFLLFYSFIIQFGIKEVLIMLPLVMGIHFRRNKQALYNINEGKYPYLLPRILFTYLLNCLAYFTFVLIIFLLLGMKNDGTINVIISIAFITTLSVLVGYLFKISDGNRIFFILALLILVNTIDLVIQQTIYSQLKINLTYIILTLLVFLIIKVIFIRRPIFK